MDIDGFRSIETALSSVKGLHIEPKPFIDEDLQYVGMVFENYRPAMILNKLGEAGLTGVNQSGPNLKLIGQSYGGDSQRRAFHLTFEDLNYGSTEALPPAV